MILALADDLTGALEAGAHFARFGIDSCVTTEREFTRFPEVQALVIDTETRHVSESEAAAVVRQVLAAVLPFDPDLFYKKTDSTMRGNIAAELRALQQAVPSRTLVYVPAYPEMGRTVRGGVLFVDGTEVHRTAFANDPLNPITQSSLARMLGDIPARIHDGETTEDIAAAAREILANDHLPLAAGPGSLAAALAAALGTPHRYQPPLLRRCLVVNGSMHPRSAEQIDLARETANEWVYLESAISPGEEVRALLSTHTFDGLIVFGGDTAFNIHTALGSPRITPLDELLPGVPISRCDDIHWVTKAGGFGAPNLLCEIHKRLT